MTDDNYGQRQDLKFSQVQRNRANSQSTGKQQKPNNRFKQVVQTDYNADRDNQKEWQQKGFQTPNTNEKNANASEKSQANIVSAQSSGLQQVYCLLKKFRAQHQSTGTQLKTDGKLQTAQQTFQNQGRGNQAYTIDKYMGGSQDQYGRQNRDLNEGGGYHIRSSGNFWIDISTCIANTGRYMDCRRFIPIVGQAGQKQQVYDKYSYSSGESGTEFLTPFSDLSTLEKSQRMNFLWGQLYRRAKGALLLIHKYNHQLRKIQLLGKIPEAGEIGKQQSDIEKDLSEARFIIIPSNPTKNKWDMFMALLVLVIALYVPLRVSFFDGFDWGRFIFEVFTDLSFLIDIVLTFFTALEKKNGQLEISKQIIARTYFRGWFLIDVASTIPVEFIDLFPISTGSQTGNTKLLRLMRLPRLWRIVKIVRLLKVDRLLKQSKGFQDFKEALGITDGSQALFKIAVTVFLLNHISSCLFFFLAKFYEFQPNCWVVKKGIIDADPILQYFVAFYWSFQTLATVGYGDVSFYTEEERVFAIVWMIFGIGFYSYTIGNMTNIIASLDQSNEELQKNLSTLKEFKKNTKMPNKLYSKIKRHLENNSKAANSFAEQEQLLNDLPQALRSEVIACTHGEIIEKIHFFQDKQSDFLLSIIVELKPLNVLKGDVIYHQQDNAEEIYFIKYGKVKLHVDINEYLDSHIYKDQDHLYEEGEEEQSGRVRNIPFISYLEGSYFGDNDIMLDLTRDDLYRDGTAVTEMECQFLILSKDAILKHKAIFSKEIGEIEALAKKRSEKHKNLIESIVTKVNLVRKDHPNEPNIDYEYYLMMKDEYHYESSETEDEDEMANLFSTNLNSVGKTKQKNDTGDQGSPALRSSSKKIVNKGLNQHEQHRLQKQAQQIEIQNKTMIEAFKTNMKVLSSQATLAQQLLEKVNQDALKSQKNLQDQNQKVQEELKQLHLDSKKTNQELSNYILRA